jgi:hypothetical protein
MRISSGVAGKMRALESLGARVFLSRQGRNWVIYLNPVLGVEKPPFSVTAVFYSLGQVEAFLDAFLLGFNLGTQNNQKEGGKNV